MRNDLVDTYPSLFTAHNNHVSKDKTFPVETGPLNNNQFLMQPL
jgi:hypothetical protein